MLASDANTLGSVREVSDGVFAYVQPDGSWEINNTGFLVGKKGVFAIDARAADRRQRGRGRTTSEPMAASSSAMLPCSSQPPGSSEGVSEPAPEHHGARDPHPPHPSWPEEAAGGRRRVTSSPVRSSRRSARRTADATEAAEGGTPTRRLSRGPPSAATIPP
jgi:hypothetical protein